MIKVLDKTFGVLEAVVLASPEPVGLANLAEKLQINKATCSRIIRELVDAGYLQQISRQAGYIAGPRVQAIGMRVGQGNRLIETATPIVYACANRTGQSVLLSTLNQGQRYILIHHNCNPTMRINLSQLSFDDAYVTATGLVLLAYATAEELEMATRLNPPDNSQLLKDAKQSMLTSEFLAKIKAEGRMVYTGPGHYLSIVAFPVFSNGRFVAALGMSAPNTDFREDMVKMVEDAANEITAGLSAIHSLG